MPTLDILTSATKPVVHYAPYGPNAIGGFDCGAKSDPATDQFTCNPSYVTCEGCKRASPGLWPELADEPLTVDGDVAVGTAIMAEAMAVGMIPKRRPDLLHNPPEADCPNCHVPMSVFNMRRCCPHCMYRSE